MYCAVYGIGISRHGLCLCILVVVFANLVGAGLCGIEWGTNETIQSSLFGIFLERHANFDDVEFLRCHTIVVGTKNILGSILSEQYLLNGV